MGRVRRGVVLKKMNQEVFSFTSHKAQQLAKTNPCLATDYVIRALGVKPKDPDTLALGAILGKAIGQLELANKCLANAGPNPLVDASSLQDVQEVRTETLTLSPNLAAIPADLDDEVEPTKLEDTLKETEATANRGQTLLQELAAEIRLNSSQKLELRDPQHGSAFGRGLYATQRLPERQTLIQERAVFVNPTKPDSSCANCLKTLAPQEGPGNVKCDSPTCNERYCSDTCRDDAIQTYHAPLCQNEEFHQWRVHVKETMQDFDATGTQSASADSKAALMLLMIGRICAVATLVQTHPLGVPPLNAMTGEIVYQPKSTFLNMGGLSMALGGAMRQPQFFLEDLLGLMALLRHNEWRVQKGFLLFRWLMFANHSCVPNAALQEVGSGDQPAELKLVTLKPIRQGEQVFIDYSSVLGARLPRIQRRAYLKNRGVDCHCSLCVRGQ